MTSRAVGTFEVQMTPQESANAVESSDGLTFARFSLVKQFHGGLDGTSRAEMLSAGTSVPGSAGYVALERFRGALDGHTGSFVLQHAGTMDRGAPRLSIQVVPDSGTGALTGLSGTLTIEIAGGKHSYEFEYTLAQPN